MMNNIILGELTSDVMFSRIPKNVPYIYNLKTIDNKTINILFKKSEVTVLTNNLETNYTIVNNILSTKKINLWSYEKTYCLYDTRYECLTNPTEKELHDILNSNNDITIKIYKNALIIKKSKKLIDPYNIIIISLTNVNLYKPLKIIN